MDKVKRGRPGTIHHVNDIGRVDTGHRRGGQGANKELDHPFKHSKLNPESTHLEL